MERKLLSWAKNTPWRRFNTSRLPCDRVAQQKASETLPALGVSCGLQAPSAHLRDGGRLPEAGPREEFGRVQRNKEARVNLDPEPGGRRKRSAFVLRLKTLSSNVSRKTARAKPTTLGQVDAGAICRAILRRKLTAQPTCSSLGRKGWWY